MSQELELSGNTDVSAESSPAPEAASSETSPNANQELSNGQESKPSQQYVPYDRFKELVDQKNEFVKRFEDQEKRYKDLESRFQSSQSPKTEQIDPKKVLERLKGIDPEFAQYNEYLMNQMEQYKQFQENFNRQQYQSNAMSIVSRLQSELKIDPVLHQGYLHQIPANTPLEQIESAYKAAHDRMAKYIDSVKRSALAEYSKAKTSDAQIPATKKGAPAPKPGNKSEFSSNPEEARSQLVKKITQSMRQSKDI